MNSSKILIIDDEEQDIKAIALALAKEGYTEISTAGGAEEGLEKARTFKPDAVLIDVVLGNTDGFDVCKQIGAIEGIAPKIIMVTGHLDAIDARKARISCANEIVEKGAGVENLARSIKNIVG